MSEQPSTSLHEVPSERQPSSSLLHRVFVGGDGLRAGWSLLLFLVVVSLILLLFGIDVRQLFSSQSAPTRPITVAGTEISDGLLLVAIVTATFLVSRVEGRPMRVYGLGATPRALPLCLTGLISGAILLSLLVATLWLTHLLVFTGRQLSGSAILLFAADWAVAFLLVALFEDFALRGFLQFTLARGLTGAVHAVTGSPHAKPIGFWIAAAILSFLFGFGHSTNAGESPLGLVSAGLIGLVFCLSLWRTGSLWWAIGFHAAWDWAQSFVFGVADSGQVAAFHLLASHPVGQPLLSGGRTGPEGSVFVLPVIALTALVILFTLPHTGWPMTPAETPTRATKPRLP